MKKLKSNSLVLNLFAFMIAAAPMMDMTTRCPLAWFGTPDYPEE